MKLKTDNSPALNVEQPGWRGCPVTGNPELIQAFAFDLSEAQTLDEARTISAQIKRGPNPHGDRLAVWAALDEVTKRRIRVMQMEVAA